MILELQQVWQVHVVGFGVFAARLLVLSLAAVFSCLQGRSGGQCLADQCQSHFLLCLRQKEAVRGRMSPFERKEGGREVGKWQKQTQETRAKQVEVREVNQTHETQRFSQRIEGIKFKELAHGLPFLFHLICNSKKQTSYCFFRVST